MPDGKEYSYNQVDFSPYTLFLPWYNVLLFPVCEYSYKHKNSFRHILAILEKVLIRLQVCIVLCPSLSSIDIVQPFSYGLLQLAWSYLNLIHPLRPNSNSTAFENSSLNAPTYTTPSILGSLQTVPHCWALRHILELSGNPFGQAISVGTIDSGLVSQVWESNTLKT